MIISEIKSLFRARIGLFQAVYGANANQFLLVLMQLNVCRVPVYDKEPFQG